MRTPTKIGAGVAVAVAVAVVAFAVAPLVAHDGLTIDSCYDSGGVYLDEINRCSHSQAEVDQHQTLDQSSTTNS